MPCLRIGQDEACDQLESLWQLQDATHPQRAQCLHPLNTVPLKISVANVSKPSYEKGSKEREGLKGALESLRKKLPIKLPLKISGQNVSAALKHPLLLTPSPISSSGL